MLAIGCPPLTLFSLFLSTLHSQEDAVETLITLTFPTFVLLTVTSTLTYYVYTCACLFVKSHYCTEWTPSGTMLYFPNCLPIGELCLLFLPVNLKIPHLFHFKHLDVFSRF